MIDEKPSVQNVATVLLKNVFSLNDFSCFQCEYESLYAIQICKNLYRCCMVKTIGRIRCFDRQTVATVPHDADPGSFSCIQLLMFPFFLCIRSVSKLTVQIILIFYSSTPFLLVMRLLQIWSRILFVSTNALRFRHQLRPVGHHPFTV
jgi:hypothetical protein